MRTPKQVADELHLVLKTAVDDKTTIIHSVYPPVVNTLTIAIGGEVFLINVKKASK